MSAPATGLKPTPPAYLNNGSSVTATVQRGPKPATYTGVIDGRVDGKKGAFYCIKMSDVRVVKVRAACISPV